VREHAREEGLGDFGLDSFLYVLCGERPTGSLNTHIIEQAVEDSYYYLK
jgi:hypothetical protein